MNIAFDTFYTLSASNFRGIGSYTKKMIESITALNKDHSLFFFSPDLNLDTQAQIRKLQLFLTGNSIDIYHVTSPVEYLFNHNEMLKRECFGDVKLAVTFYDVIPYLYPDVYLTDKIFQDRFSNIMEFTKNCDMIFAISETTKNDGIKYLDMDPGKIFVIYGGRDPQYQRVIDPNILLKYGIYSPYILFVGGLEYRKNFDRLLKAFGKINHKLQTKYQFVLTGYFSEIEKQAILNKGLKYGLVNQFIFTSYVQEEELIKLYSQSTLFAFPSLYEGLGLPLIEAMACGAPVLTSNTSSLNEISNNAAYKVNPENIEEIANGLYQMLSDPKLLQKYSQKGLKHSEQFKWENVALKILQVYENN